MTILVNDLRLVFEKALDEDYSAQLPDTASSYDMKLLLQAFAQLLVALRFGSDSYARGDSQRAKRVFSDAYRVGASLNNLAAVELAMGNHKVAEDLYHKAIVQAKDMLITAKAQAADDKQLQRLLSDREGNLAVCYLEQNDFPKAFELLERLLEEDKQALYIRGCVMKQGTLGQYYLKQGEIKSAERVFLSALTFIRNLKTQQGSNSNSGSSELQDLAEIEGAEQIALFNMALFYEAMYKQNKATTPYHIVEAKFLEALTTPANMHVSTVKKILLVLRQMFQDNNNETMINQLDELAVQHDFILTSNK